MGRELDTERIGGSEALQRSPPWLAWSVAAVATAFVASLAFNHFRENKPRTERVRFQFQTPGAIIPEYVAPSPDGRLVAFVTTDGGPNQIWIRASTRWSRTLSPEPTGRCYRFGRLTADGLDFLSGTNS